MSKPETAELAVEPDLASTEPEPGAEAETAEPETGPGDELAPEAAESAESAAAEAEAVPDAAAASGSDEPVSVEAERDAYLADLQRGHGRVRQLPPPGPSGATPSWWLRLRPGWPRRCCPCLDACEAAVRQGVEGMEPVRSQLVGVLAGQGLEVIDGTDEPFDPNRHEAVMTADPDEDSPADPTEPAVVEILRTGYAWKGRVLRPAMVKVAGPGAGG